MAKTPPKLARTPVLEWIASGLGGLIVLAALGVLAFAMIRGGDSPADPVIEVVSVTPASQGWRVEIEAVNRGERAAAQMVIEGRAGAQVAAVTLDYLPGHGRRHAALLFAEDPGDTIDLRATGWTDP